LAKVGGGWIDLAGRIGGYLAEQEDDTVTFLLGAGASRSSGAPSTPEVIEALTERHPDEFPDSRVSAGMDAIGEAEVEGAIRPLFEHVTPHVGYLSLAALARSTRVFIVNLNWDRAVEDACDLLGVKCATVVLDEKKDLDKGLAHIEACLKDRTFRVVNFHLHGMLGGEIRLAPKKTQAFQDRTTRLLWSSFFAHPTVVVGATLTGERDVTGLLTASSEGPGEKRSPFWLFSRQPERTERAQDTVAAELLTRNESDLNFRGDPFVDFDRIMVEILARRRRRPLRDVFGRTSLAQPDSDELIFPSPKLLSNHVLKESDGRFLALVGERKVGKSITAKLLAHWASLRTEEPIQVLSRFRRSECARTLESLRDGTLRLGVHDIAIFDDPFTVTPGETDEEFVQALLEVVHQPDAPRVLITASLSAWEQAATTHPELTEAADLAIAKPTDWFDGEDLAALAEHPTSDRPAMVTRRVLEGVASTPERVAAANAGEFPSSEEQVIRDKLALLRCLDPDAQRFLALVRFYELSRTVLPQTELAQRLQESMPIISPALEPLLREAELTEEHQLFAHYTDRIAFDRLYLEKEKDLRSSVVEVAYGRRVVDHVCEIWQTINDLRCGKLGRVKALASGGPAARRKILEWGPLLLEEAANSRDSRGLLTDVLQLVLEVDGERDFWGLRELVYEVVRLWPELHDSAQAREFIKRTLVDEKRMGRYCVFEALLYFQGATHRDVWDHDYVLRIMWNRVTASIGDLIEDAERHGGELALIFDAVSWTRPPLRERELLGWVAPILDALTKHESLKGALALTCLYHPAGLALFAELGRVSPLADISNLSERQVAQASAMVRWHYVHQSRGRALLTRRRLEPAAPELLRREQRERRIPMTEADAIIKFIKRMAHFSEHRGWAIHLAFNLLCTAGTFDDRLLGPLMRDLSDADDGVVTAALTYRISGGAHAQIQEYFRRPTNANRLLDVMLDGCQVRSVSPSDEAVVGPPRFMAGRSPQAVHEELDTQWQHRLRDITGLNDPELPRRIYEILNEAEAEGFVDTESKWLLLHHVQRGDLRPLDIKPARARRDPELARWTTGRDEFDEIVVLAAQNIAPDTIK
jgi:hypothetical protein